MEQEKERERQEGRKGERRRAQLMLVEAERTRESRVEGREGVGGLRVRHDKAEMNGIRHTVCAYRHGNVAHAHKKSTHTHTYTCTILWPTCLILRVVLSRTTHTHDECIIDSMSSNECVYENVVTYHHDTLIRISFKANSSDLSQSSACALSRYTGDGSWDSTRHLVKSFLRRVGGGMMCRRCIYHVTVCVTVTCARLIPRLFEYG